MESLGRKDVEIDRALSPTTSEISFQSIEPWEPLESFEDDRIHQEREVKEVVEISESEDDEDIIISASNNSETVNARKINHAIALPDFPDSSKNGTAYIVNTSGEKVDERYISKIQYCFARSKPPRHTKCPLLDNLSCQHYTYHCTGAKICEFLNPEIRNMRYYQTSDNIWNIIQQNRQESHRYSLKRDIASWVFAFQKRFGERSACYNQEISCSWTIHIGQQETISGLPFISIRCSNWTRNSKHFWKSIPSKFTSEIDFLTALINNNYQETERCYVVKQNLSRKNHCDVDHIQGRGSLIQMKCPVKFHLYIPLNTDVCYLIFISIGKHEHPPPELSKTPKKIIDEIDYIIQRINDPSLTLNHLVRNPLLQDFCRSQNIENLSELHPSLVNIDKIRLLLKNHQQLLYPFGQDLEAVQYQLVLQKRSDKESYIKEFVHTDDIIYIICFFDKQAQVLASLESFEIDMSFKRIRQSNMNEIVFASYSNEQNKILTLCRIFTTGKTSNHYQQIFLSVFTLISESIKKPFKWQHLDNEGPFAIIVDMDSAQTLGFGLYLQSIDPQNRLPYFHIRSTVIYCQIHFIRGIHKVLGPSLYNPQLFHLLSQIIECQSTKDYYELLENIIVSNWSNSITEWARHKKHQIIASGLNENCSLIEKSVFRRLRKNTNSVEQTHYKSNAMGKQLTLIKAIQTGRSIDLRDVLQHNNFLSHGVQYNYRSNNLSQRYYHMEQRIRRKRPRQTRSPAIDPQDDILSQVSSSGNLSSRRSSQSSRSRRRIESSSTPNLRRLASFNQVDTRGDILSIEFQERQARLELEKQKVRELELKNKREELEIQKLERDLQL